MTGATSGIGYETALGLARAGARVGIVGRDAGRTDEAASRIRDAVPGAVIDVFLADLSSQAEIRRLSAEVRALYPRLDVLVNNAGAIFDARHVTVDGLERTWALDHLAYVQLTLDLLDLMKASAPARIVNVASRAHKRGLIDLEDLDGARRYGTWKAYSQAKLGNVLFTAALARRLARTGVTVNSLHPGVIASGFARRHRGMVRHQLVADPALPQQPGRWGGDLPASGDLAGRGRRQRPVLLEMQPRLDLSPRSRSGASGTGLGVEPAAARTSGIGRRPRWWRRAGGYA